MSTISVYFDESGYTGENLLKEDQPTFSYATVEIDNDEAEKLVSSILEKYPKQTQSGELKATTLLKTEKGREAIFEILSTIQNDIKISVSDKKYALACKFFEYMIEPVIAPKSTIFYSLNFHKFISNFLYFHFITDKNGLTKELFIRFEKLMRDKNENNFYQLLALHDERYSSHLEPFIQELLIFIQIHKDIIWDEIKDLPKWSIDLSIMALNTLFSELGRNGDEIIAYCDNSKPLFEQKEIFTHMIGRKDILYHPFIENEGQKIPITYNLKELKLVDSKDYKAIQLADVVAGTASFVLNTMYEQTTEKFYLEVKEILLSQNTLVNIIFSDREEYNFEHRSVNLNVFLFKYLVECSKEGKDILDDVENHLILLDNTLSKQFFLKVLK